MSNRKRVILLAAGFLGFAAFLITAYFGYDWLSSEYNKENNKIQTEATENSTKQNNKSKFKAKIIAADFTVYDENYKEVKLSDYRGTPIIINFWASWCPPCKAEMPAFNKLSNKYKKDKIAILMIDLTDGERESVDQAKAFIKENNYKMNVLFDSKMDAANKYNITAIPRTIIIDKDGYIINDYSGAISEETLENQIKSLISS